MNHIEMLRDKQQIKLEVFADIPRNIREKRNEMKYMTNPIYNKKAGTVSVSVFENTGKTKDKKEFSFKSVNLQKSFKNKEDEWENRTLSLRADDIPKAIMLLNKAYEFCLEKNKPESD